MCRTFLLQTQFLTQNLEQITLVLTQVEVKKCCGTENLNQVVHSSAS